MLAYTDYLMIITPPESVINDISRYKRASVNIIGHFEGMQRRANIVITQQSRCKPFLAQPAIAQMEQRLYTMPPVELQLSGFRRIGNKPAGISICACIKKTEQTENWFKLLTKQIGVKIKDFVPHIPVVENIPANDLTKLWPNFEHLTIDQTFQVNSLTILHRETYVEYCEWRVYKELFFRHKLRAF